MHVRIGHTVTIFITLHMRFIPEIIPHIHIVYTIADVVHVRESRIHDAIVFKQFLLYIWDKKKIFSYCTLKRNKIYIDVCIASILTKTWYIKIKIKQMILYNTHRNEVKHN